MEEINMATMQDIVASVDEQGGVATLTMRELRHAYGAGRLGIYVVDAISRALRNHGLGHFPRRLPRNQNEQVRVFKLGSPVGEVIDAAIHVGKDHDQFLREVGGAETAAVLQKVRELVSVDLE